MYQNFPPKTPSLHLKVLQNKEESTKRNDKPRAIKCVIPQRENTSSTQKLSKKLVLVRSSGDDFINCDGVLRVDGYFVNNSNEIVMSEPTIVVDPRLSINDYFKISEDKRTDMSFTVPTFIPSAESVVPKISSRKKILYLCNLPKSFPENYLKIMISALPYPVIATSLINTPYNHNNAIIQF